MKHDPEPPTTTAQPEPPHPLLIDLARALAEDARLLLAEVRERAEGSA